MENTPILTVGNYGTHILKNPAGTFSFFGTVPETCAKSYKTYEDALGAFEVFFKSQNKDWQRKHVANLRNDVFVKFFG